MSVYWDPQDELRYHAQTGGGVPLAVRKRSVELPDIALRGAANRVAIRLADDRDDIRAACALLNDRYAWRGYGASHDIAANAHHMTFTADVDDDVAGTITLAVDSAEGLAIDRTFKAEIDVFRATGSRVCELTKFAFEPNVQSKAVMAALFHIVFVYGRRTYGCTDLFIEVNPRHVRFYEAMLGFQRVGAVRINASVAAPAQLMWLKVSAIGEFIARWGGGQEPAGSRSLYPFFFSADEEARIYRLLTCADGHGQDVFEWGAPADEAPVTEMAACPVGDDLLSTAPDDQIRLPGQ